MQQGWKNLEWPFVGALGLLAIVLGFTGFQEHFLAAGESRSILDLTYLTLQLFVLESGAVSGVVPWKLEAARFLAPTVAGYAAVRALAVLFREELSRFRMRFLRNHVVICALGRKGLMLARSLRERGDRVVVIEVDAENDFIETAREHGVLVLIGDGRDPRVLRAAGVHRASHLVVVSGDDGVNAEVAVRARGLVTERKGVPLSCVTHIVDPQLCDLLRMHQVGGPAEERIRLDFFNVFEGGARALLREYPVVRGDRGDVDEGQSPHIAVVGLGGFGQSLLAQAARQWKEARDGPSARLKATVVDRRATALTEALTAQHPWLDTVCEVDPRDLAVESRAFWEGSFLFDARGQPSVSAVYVCLDDDSRGMAAAFSLHRHLADKGVPVVVRMVEASGLAALLQEGGAPRGEYEEIKAFGVLDRICDADLLHAGIYETLARAIHREYLIRAGREASKDGAAPTFSPSAVPWEDLPEVLKESNRDQAMHIGVKLRAIGCDLQPLTDLGAEAFRFRRHDPDEVELLARMEHERWVEERKRLGWTFGPLDRARKRTPHLVPWEELPEEIRETDRMFIRSMPTLLAKAGFQIVRVKGHGSKESG